MCPLLPGGWSTGEELHNNAGHNANTDAERLNVTTGGIVQIAPTLPQSLFAPFSAATAPACQPIKSSRRMTLGAIKSALQHFGYFFPLP